MSKEHLLRPVSGLPGHLQAGKRALGPSFLLELPWEALRILEDLTLVLSNLSQGRGSRRICAASSATVAVGIAARVSNTLGAPPEAAHASLSPVA